MTASTPLMEVGAAAIQPASQGHQAGTLSVHVQFQPPWLPPSAATSRAVAHGAFSTFCSWSVFVSWTRLSSTFAQSKETLSSFLCLVLTSSCMEEQKAEAPQTPRLSFGANIAEAYHSDESGQKAAIKTTRREWTVKQRQAMQICRNCQISCLKCGTQRLPAP